jgi:anthranilate phosphoribosyltransferase
VATSIAEGIARARAAIASGAAKNKLEQFVSLTQKLGAANG